MCKKNKDVKFPCSVCNNNLNSNQPAMLCSKCNLWSHNKCNDIDKQQYREYQLNPELTFYCLKYKKDILPFINLNDHEFNYFVKRGEPHNNIKFTNFTPSLFQKQQFDKLNKEIEDYNSRVINDETESEYNHPLTSTNM